jgi:hypothetical protein
MSKKLWKKSQAVVASYYDRCNEREITMMTATMNLVAYFISIDTSGDTDLTKKANAELKVGQLSNEVSAYLYPYRLGNVQPLISAINASTLPFMDVDAKANIINNLTV